MVRIATLGLAVLVALVVVVVGPGAVSASTHEFVASKAGTTTSKGSTQTFKTGAGTIACASVAGTGTIASGKSTVHKEALTYSGCEAFGFPKVKISTVDFEFSAEGAAKLEKMVTVTPEGAGCEVLIPAQTVESVTFTTESGKLKAVASINKIHSRGTGGECGGENTEGSFTGTMVATLEGGTLEYK